jgi:sugar transferase EpsL
MSRRLVDIVVSLTALTLLGPLMVVLALLIRLTSKGPALFQQERAGLHGRPFTFYKFRTMRVDTDPFGTSPKGARDLRLTGIGRWLREYSLDELPQLLNILKGDMTFIGPRPLYVAQIFEWNEEQKKRLLVKPGLTGLAQVSGRAGLTREDKLALDVQYVETRSMILDCKILLATIVQVFRRTDIYEKRYSTTEYTRKRHHGHET